MVIRVELQECDLGPGTALFVLTGWDHDVGSSEFSIQRNQDGKFLADDMEWNGSEVWHTLENLRPSDQGYSAKVGPSFVDPIVDAPNAAYRVSLRSAGGSGQSVLIVSPSLLKSSAANAGPAGSAGVGSQLIPGDVSPPAVAKEPEPVVTPPEPEPIPDPEPEEPDVTDDAGPEYEPVKNEDEDTKVDIVPPAGDPPGGSGGKPGRAFPLIPVLGGLVVVAIVAGAAWYFLLREGTPTLPVADVPAIALPAECDRALFTGTEDRAFVQQCLNIDPSAEIAIEVANQAEAAGQCDATRLLLIKRARDGDADVALAYAQKLDPATHTASDCFPNADGETAAYWYAIPAQNGNALAIERLNALQPSP